MKFQNVVSLGHFCSVSLELERMGYRSFSLPFDWLITGDFSKVLHIIDNSFSQFLIEENLVQEDINPKYYYDKNNDIHFYHDFVGDETLEAQLPVVKAKFKRRINRFYETISQPTLFIRYCLYRQEIDYVLENGEVINRILTKYNSNNKIIYICNSELADNQFINRGGGICRKER